MTYPELENLVQTGQLKREKPSQSEIQGPITSGQARLNDSTNTQNSLEGRFDLAYNAAHALAHAALRRLGYRSDSRYTVFQALPYSLGVPAEVWRMLAKCHTLRNGFEYEGMSNVDDRLVHDLIEAASAVRSALADAMKKT